MFLLGKPRSIVPYQGSKWKVRHTLADILTERGFDELTAVLLGDSGPWGTTHRLLVEYPTDVIEHLEQFAQRDPKEVYDDLQGEVVPSHGDPAFAAEHLFLQRLAHSGKAVGTKSFCWDSPGFNTTSAYGVKGTDRFGEVKPMIPALISVLKTGYAFPDPRVRSRRGPADRLIGRPGSTDPSDVVYLDPPYEGTTHYPNGRMSRDEVVRLATAAHDNGSFVVVSEGEAIDELVARGWTSRCLLEASNSDAPFKSRAMEWVTVSPP